MTSVEVTPAILAARMGWSWHKAWRRMRDLAVTHPAAVFRHARTYVASASALAALVPGFVLASPLEREVAHLRGRIAELERRLDAEVRTRIDLQRGTTTGSKIVVQRSLQKAR